MKKSILKNERGITLIILMLVIIIMAILVAFAVKNIDIGVDIRDYNYMCADIELLESKIMTYYNNNNEIPIDETLGAIADAKTMLDGQASSKDNDVYYKVDVKKLFNITLNYGGGTLENKDIYIINEATHEVYYLKGVQFENTTYHAAKVSTSSGGGTTHPDIHTHTLNLVTATEATCTTTGNIEYYSCSDCGKYFEDSEGTVEITDKSSVVIAATGHTYGAWVITIEPTTTSTGLKTRTCSKCSTTETAEIPMLEAEMISFTISTTTYNAVKGMTWEEWVNSDYNTVKAQITTYSGTQRIFIGPTYNKYVTGVVPTDTISDGINYLLTTTGSGSIM